jgi:DNA-binding MarR family transcriptional regulator
VASGRSLPAELTRQGTELLDRTDSGIRAAEQRLLAGLTEQDQRALRRILAEIA